MSKPTKEITLSKMRWMLWLLGTFKIPMLAFCKPKLIELNANRVEVKIKLRRRTKNHLKSMYFGALAVGADVAGGIHAFYFAEKSGKKVSFAFKSMKAEFLMRAESDITFIGDQGNLVEKAFEKSDETGERVNQLVIVNAFDENKNTVATFELEVSVKVK